MNATELVFALRLLIAALPTGAHALAITTLGDGRERLTQVNVEGGRLVGEPWGIDGVAMRLLSNTVQETTAPSVR
jgi:hypothetical protein